MPVFRFILVAIDLSVYRLNDFFQPLWYLRIPFNTCKDYLFTSNFHRNVCLVMLYPLKYMVTVCLWKKIGYLHRVCCYATHSEKQQGYYRSVSI